jgi:Mce-associated membrane protein
MTESDTLTGTPPGPSSLRRRHPVVVAVLGLLAVLLAAACVTVAIWPTAVPGESKAEEANDRDLAVRVAATAVTKAFLDVDYHDMDPRIDKVLKLSTGTFKNQYDTAKVDLKTQAQQAKAVATGSVRYVGIGDIDDDAAVVYVAADTKVSNSSIEQEKAAGKNPEDRRYYRFQLNLSKVGNHWLLNDLQFIS